MKSLEELVRKNIWSLKPYSSARDEYSGHQAHTFLDANENPHHTGVNRYPDPLQRDLKERIAKVKGVSAASIFLGNGSDEAIDLMYRVFCEPRVDNVVAIDPTYGMYGVCADINNIEYRTVKLDASYNFSAKELLAAADSNTKVMFLCSPNNPTGNDLDMAEVIKTIESFQGIVVVDEAYIDFAGRESLLRKLGEYPNLIVLQTFSKAFGAAALRLGMAFASPEIIATMNKVKYPYNVNELTQERAMQILENVDVVKTQVKYILEQRTAMMEEFGKIDIVETVYPSDANFFLAKIKAPADATAVYNYLVGKGVIVRNRTKITLCKNALRITVGLENENQELVNCLKAYKA